MKRILAALGIVLGVGWYGHTPAFASVQRKSPAIAFAAANPMNVLATCQIGKEVELTALETSALALSSGSHFEPALATASSATFAMPNRSSRTPSLNASNGWALAHREVWLTPDLVRGSGRPLLGTENLFADRTEARPISART